VDDAEDGLFVLLFAEDGLFVRGFLVLKMGYLWLLFKISYL